jgi:hypothetical protein
MCNGVYVGKSIFLVPVSGSEISFEGLFCVGRMSLKCFVDMSRYFFGLVCHFKR